MTTAKIRDKPNFLVLLNKQRTAPKTTSGIINPSSPKVVKNFAKLAKKAFTLLPGREPESMGFNTQAEPGGPVGEYVMVQFVARAGDLTATERVVMQKEQGRWKIIGYFINKRSQTQIMGSR